MVHGGEADRFVLYATLHHPGLGTPSLLPESKVAPPTSGAGASLDGMD